MRLGQVVRQFGGHEVEVVLATCPPQSGFLTRFGVEILSGLGRDPARPRE